MDGDWNIVLSKVVYTLLVIFILHFVLTIYITISNNFHKRVIANYIKYSLLVAFCNSLAIAMISTFLQFLVLAIPFIVIALLLSICMLKYEPYSKVKGDKAMEQRIDPKTEVKMADGLKSQENIQEEEKPEEEVDHTNLDYE